MPDDATPFALVVRFTVRPGSEQAFDRLTEETTSGIRERESGTLVYACHTVEGQPRQRIFYELYRNRPHSRSTRRKSTSAGSWTGGPHCWNPPKSTS